RPDPDRGVRVEQQTPARGWHTAPLAVTRGASGGAVGSRTCGREISSARGWLLVHASNVASASESSRGARFISGRRVFVDGRHGRRPHDDGASGRRHPSTDYPGRGGIGDHVGVHKVSSRGAGVVSTGGAHAT